MSRLRRGLCIALAVAGVLGVVPALHAKPPHKAALGRYYGTRLADGLKACSTCHMTDDEIAARLDDLDSNESQPWNAFGRRLAELGKAADGERPKSLIERLQLAADEDADGDGTANELELLAGRRPGSADDKPAAEELARAEQSRQEFRARLRPEYAWRPFEPVTRPAVPTVRRADWVRNPIDAYIAQEQERRGLEPRPEAPKAVLLRRVHLDLIGLPPTRDELRAFLADESPDAYERAVDRLLASPGYGERWGRHWMDVWRYSDWAGWGQQVRDSQPHIWRWRDWIVESTNADAGYDRMVAGMLAADELAPADPDALRATGFLVRNYKRLSREQWMRDVVDHTSRAFLGLTLKCAQCHDHMYDLVTQEDHYRFRAFFETYDVRTDPVPGELNAEKDGLPRVHDANLEAVTYFYNRGDERTPDKDRPMTPTVPVLLGGGLSMEPVTLPVESFYPSLRPQAVADMRAQARAAVESSQVALNTAREQESQARAQLAQLQAAPAAEATAGAASAEAEKNIQNAAAAAALAERKHRSAEAALASFEARATAEQAKYLAPAQSPEDLDKLARAASRTERGANFAKADHDLLAAEQKLAAARAAATEDEKTKKAVQEAEAAVEKARKEQESAKGALEADKVEYSPLGQVYAKTSTGRRAALAKWIVSPQNPLTARVAANHIWARHFGRGLVASLDDFGQNGQEPSHPALLDWLAAELMGSAEPGARNAELNSSAPRSALRAPRSWSMKHLHRLIVTSNTYRTASTPDEACAAVDPENVHLWRFSPRRAEAEVVRDSVLHVAGALDRRLGGPELDYKLGLAERRRSVYFRHAPEKQMEFLRLFDMASPTECYERRESIIPQQALALANSELTILQARRLARRLYAETGSGPSEFVAAAFEQVLSRPATEAEIATCTAFLEQQAAQFQSKPPGPSTDNLADLNQPAADPALRARENLIHVLMNHHDFVTVR